MYFSLICCKIERFLFNLKKQLIYCWNVYFWSTNGHIVPSNENLFHVPQWKLNLLQIKGGHWLRSQQLLPSKMLIHKFACKLLIKSYFNFICIPIQYYFIQNSWQPVCTCLTDVVSSDLCPEIICVCTRVCKLCFVCMINTNFRVNNYFMNLFYLKKQPLGSGQGHGL